MKKTNSDVINYKALQDLEARLGADVKILDAEVKNKWLIASLSSGVKFWVKNK